jgi:hypothetical protein
MHCTRPRDECGSPGAAHLQAGGRQPLWMHCLNPHIHHTVNSHCNCLVCIIQGWIGGRHNPQAPLVASNAAVYARDREQVQLQAS